VCVRLMRSMRLSVFNTQEQTLQHTGWVISPVGINSLIRESENVKLSVAKQAESSLCTRVSTSEGTGNNV
jgi:hypothetical protein